MYVQYYERRYSLGKEKQFIVEKSFMSVLKKRKKNRKKNRKKKRKKRKSCKSVGVKPVKIVQSSHFLVAEEALHAICRTLHGSSWLIKEISGRMVSNRSRGISVGRRFVEENFPFIIATVIVEFYVIGYIHLNLFFFCVSSPRWGK